MNIVKTAIVSSGYSVRQLFKSRLSIVYFHRIDAPNQHKSPWAMSKDRFEECLRWLSKHHNILPLTEAVDRLKAKSLPKNALVITFDDSYKEHYSVALPVLQSLGLHATFFLNTSPMSGKLTWHDLVIAACLHTQKEIIEPAQFGIHNMTEPFPLDSEARRNFAASKILEYVRASEHSHRDSIVEQLTDALLTPQQMSELPQRTMLSTEDIQVIANAGMTIGTHTHSHAVLSSVDLKAAREEIGVNREILSCLAKHPIDLFAYPCGRPNRDYRREHVGLLKSMGFKAAVSTAWGSASYHDDIMQLPRFLPWDATEFRFHLRMLWNSTQPPRSVC